MDKLEEYIKKNREDLDKYSPASGVWRNIRKSMMNRKTSVRQWFSIAAMVAVIFGTSIAFIKMGYFRSHTGITKSIDANELKESPQLKETEIYYNNLVNSLYHEATPMLTVNPEIKKELSTDMAHLDSICSEIRKDLKDNVANQEVVEALIQNYRIKIRLLEDMLAILKANENIPEKKKNYEL
jgi:hypothetical protein